MLATGTLFTKNTCLDMANSVPPVFVTLYAAIGCVRGKRPHMIGCVRGKRPHMPVIEEEDFILDELILLEEIG